jgi:adenosylcobinamide-GDP ribazoletransferase
MSLGNAFSYLTVLPVPFKRHVPLGRSVHFFPMIGVGMGSLSVLVFVGLQALLPTWLCCIAVVGFFELMTGGIHLRAVAELTEGRRTFAGSGFGARTERRWPGYTAVAFVLLAKAAALALIRPDWQPFAVLLAPILGRSSQALGIIFSRHRLAPKGPPDPAIRRRQIRALFFTGALMTVFLLFPWQAAVILAAQYFILIIAFYRYLNRSLDGLTVQTLGSVAELSETGFLLACAVLSRALT